MTFHPVFFIKVVNLYYKKWYSFIRFSKSTSKLITQTFKHKKKTQPLTIQYVLSFTNFKSHNSSTTYFKKFSYLLTLHQQKMFRIMLRICCVCLYQLLWLRESLFYCLHPKIIKNNVRVKIVSSINTVLQPKATRTYYKLCC